MKKKVSRLQKNCFKGNYDDELIKALQNRIKELEQINEEHKELNGKLRAENKMYKGAYEHVMIANKKLECEKEVILAEMYDSNYIINKAIKYIECKTNYESYLDGRIKKYYGNLLDVLNILQGKSDE